MPSSHSCVSLIQLFNLDNRWESPSSPSSCGSDTPSFGPLLKDLTTSQLMPRLSSVRLDRLHFRVDRLTIVFGAQMPSLTFSLREYLDSGFLAPTLPCQIHTFLCLTAGLNHKPVMALCPPLFAPFSCFTSCRSTDTSGTLFTGSRLISRRARNETIKLSINQKNALDATLSLSWSIHRSLSYCLFLISKNPLSVPTIKCFIL